VSETTTKGRAGERLKTVGHADGVERVHIRIDFAVSRDELYWLLACRAPAAGTPTPTKSGLMALVRSALITHGLNGDEDSGSIENATEEQEKWAAQQLERLWPID
jgi:hypothetical protein